MVIDAANNLRPARYTDSVRREIEAITSYLVRVRASPRRSIQPTRWVGLHGTVTFPYRPLLLTSITQAWRGLVIHRELVGSTPTAGPRPGADVMVRAEVTFTMRWEIGTAWRR